MFLKIITKIITVDARVQEQCKRGLYCMNDEFSCGPSLEAALSVAPRPSIRPSVCPFVRLVPPIFSK